MQVIGKSDVGLKRELNEDSFAVEACEGYTVAVVCDGMGGANAGEVASKLACECFIGTILPELREINDTVTDETERIIGIDRAIYKACATANKKIYDDSMENAEHEGMGTTLTGFIINSEKVWVFNVGDSRVYYSNGRGIKQLTVDHSFVQALVDAGSITPQEALYHPNRNVILRALGVDESVECDVFHFENEGGYYFACSDGMSNYFDEKKLAKILNSEKTLSEKADEFIEFANSRGGSDNITVVLVDTER